MRASCAAAIVIALSAGTCLAFTHQDEVATLATAVAVAQVASDRCPDILVFAEGLRILQSNSHLVPADDMALQLEIRGMMKTFAEQVTKSPQAWCNDVLEDFGPDGSKMPGLLKRQ